MKILTHRNLMRTAAAALALASFANAGFDALRSRDAERFAIRPAKEFKADRDLVVVVMREEIPRGGGYTYQYPRNNPAPVITDKDAKQGDLSMEIELIANDYSGVAICIAGSVDLEPYLEEGTLEFWIKGSTGDEVAQYVLLDDGVKSNGEAYQVKAQSKGVGGISKDWKHVSIPLKMYGRQGEYWDIKNQRSVNGPFAWTNFKGFRLEVRKDENKEFKVWIDDIVIKKVGQAYEGPSGYPFRNEL